ncbi:MAG TPA: hypothetical protein VFF37_07245 [Streptomyces sp.]|nr:hypothetical protein [Streptomyces sp.]
MTDAHAVRPLTAAQLIQLHQGIEDHQLTVLKGLGDALGATRTLPACPGCGAAASEIVQSHKRVPEIDLMFPDCGHRFRASRDVVLEAFRGPLRKATMEP